MSKDRGGDVSATNSADRKNNGGGGTDPLLDAASLFGEYIVYERKNSIEREL